MNDLERQLLEVLADVQALRQANEPWIARWRLPLKSTEKPLRMRPASVRIVKVFNVFEHIYVKLSQ
jgi:hypothetical protein